MSGNIVGAIEGMRLADVISMERAPLVMKEGRVYRNDWAAAGAR